MVCQSNLQTVLDAWKNVPELAEACPNNFCGVSVRDFYEGKFFPACHIQKPPSPWLVYSFVGHPWIVLPVYACIMSVFDIEVMGESHENLKHKFVEHNMPNMTVFSSFHLR